MLSGEHQPRPLVERFGDCPFAVLAARWREERRRSFFAVMLPTCVCQGSQCSSGGIFQQVPVTHLECVLLVNGSVMEAALLICIQDFTGKT